MSLVRWLVVIVAAAFVWSCTKQPEVVLYTSVDEPYLRQMVKRFELASGVKVILVTDGEGSKTTGLAERVLAEKDRPRADVYWGNEPFHTIRLAEAGALARYVPPGSAEIPARYKDAEGRWTGVGFRARMIAVNSRRELAALTANLSGVEGLAHPSLRNRIAIASPATGTTSGHLAALYVVWGEERYRAWLMGLRQNNVRIVGGNAVVANLVGDGTMLAGLTDNDDISATLSAGGVLRGLLPDQTLSPEDAKRSGTTLPADAGSAEAPGMGTLLVPTTVGLVAGGPNPESGKRLIEFITDRRMEEQLFADRFLYGTLRDLEKTGVRGLAVDLNEVSREMRRATEIALTILQDRAAP